MTYDATGWVVRVDTSGSMYATNIAATISGEDCCGGDIDGWVGGFFIPNAAFASVSGTGTVAVDDGTNTCCNDGGTCITGDDGGDCDGECGEACADDGHTCDHCDTVGTGPRNDTMTIDITGVTLCECITIDDGVLSGCEQSAGGSWVGGFDINDQFTLQQVGNNPTGSACQWTYTEANAFDGGYFENTDCSGPAANGQEDVVIELTKTGANTWTLDIYTDSGFGRNFDIFYAAVTSTTDDGKDCIEESFSNSIDSGDCLGEDPFFNTAVAHSGDATATCGV